MPTTREILIASRDIVPATSREGDPSLSDWADRPTLRLDDKGRLTANKPQVSEDAAVKALRNGKPRPRDLS
jgi:hypothetical protein